MLFFFILGSLSIFNSFYFIVFMGWFFSSIMLKGWTGNFVLFDSSVYILMYFMSLTILLVIVMTEKNKNLLLLSSFLIYFSLHFFFAQNLLVLYIFFELSMFPILLMILGYGAQIEKINSSYYLIFYASFCSLPFLFIYFINDLNFLTGYMMLNLSWELLFFLCLTFLMKFPLYFLHLWLPKAHVEAPTTASMLLAGLLLKLGTVGFLRLLKSLNFNNLEYWMIIACLGMLSGVMVCLFQSDSKAMMAYSSVMHMNFLFLGLLFFSNLSKEGSLIMMLSHGFTSTLMFFLIGEFYHYSNTRMIYYMNSVMNSSILMSILILITFLSNGGTPPSLSFISEFLVILMSLKIFGFFVILMFMYFFLSFYMSFFFITNSFGGKDFFIYFNMILSGVYFFLFLMFNIFLLNWFI